MPEIIKAETIDTTPLTNAPRTYVEASMLAFDVDNFAGKKRVFNAMNSADSLDQHLKDNKITSLIIEGVILEHRTFLDKVSGEVCEEDNAYILTEDDAFFTKSQGLVRSAKNLIYACGGVFPHEDVIIEIYEVVLDKKRTLKEFRLL